MKALMIATVMTFGCNAFAADMTKSEMNTEKLNIQSTSLPAPSQTSVLADWTVMIYVNAKNDLEKYELREINEAEAAGSTANVQVVAQLGRMNGQAGDVHDDGDWTGARRWHLEKDADMEHITSPVVWEKKKIDMGDVRELEDFIRWAKTAYPAKRYILMVGGHGTNWLELIKAPKDQETKADLGKMSSAMVLGPASSRPSRPGVGIDWESGHQITLPQLRMVMERTGRNHILALAACLMQSLETAAELSTVTPFIVGSEDALWDYTFDNTAFLLNLQKNYAAPTSLVARDLVKTSMDYFRAHPVTTEDDGDFPAGYPIGSQLSLVNTAAAPYLMQRLSTWTSLAMEINDHDAALAARTQRMRNTYGMQGDLYEFVSIYAANARLQHPKTKEFLAVSDDLLRYLREKTVLLNDYIGNNKIGIPFTRTHGLAITLPPAKGDALSRFWEDPSKVVTRYSQLKISQMSSWPKFLMWLQAVK